MNTSTDISLLIDEASSLYSKLQTGLKVGGIYDTSRSRYRRVLRLQRKAFRRYLRRIIAGAQVMYRLKYPDMPDRKQV